MTQTITIMRDEKLHVHLDDLRTEGWRVVKVDYHALTDSFRVRVEQ